MNYYIIRTDMGGDLQFYCGEQDHVTESFTVLRKNAYTSQFKDFVEEVAACLREMRIPVEVCSQLETLRRLNQKPPPPPPPPIQQPRLVRVSIPPPPRPPTFDQQSNTFLLRYTLILTILPAIAGTLIAIILVVPLLVLRALRKDR